MSRSRQLHKSSTITICGVQQQQNVTNYLDHLRTIVIFLCHRLPFLGLRVYMRKHKSSMYITLEMKREEHASYLQVQLCQLSAECFQLLLNLIQKSANTKHQTGYFTPSKLQHNTKLSNRTHLLQLFGLVVFFICHGSLLHAMHLANLLRCNRIKIHIKCQVIQRRRSSMAVSLLDNIAATSRATLLRRRLVRLANQVDSDQPNLLLIRSMSRCESTSSACD